ncbi:MAG: polyketide cyclase [Pedobacter sp.]|nr:MAG: polyketide cyclase [Pedobacter sp.]
MTVLLAIVLCLAIIIFFLLFLALITKKDYQIEREIIIDKSTDEVFNYIKLMKNQEQYSVWVMKDPNVRIEYKGIDGTEGFISNWEGNKQAGKGEQEIMKIIDQKSIHIQIRFEKPFKNVGEIYMFTTPITATQTNLAYKMEGKNTFPLNLMNLIIDGLLGKDLYTSLENIKRIVSHK